MLNRYNFASSSFEFSTFMSSRNAKKNCIQSSFPSFALQWGYSAGLLEVSSRKVTRLFDQLIGLGK